MNKETLNTYNERLSTNNDTITNINSLLKRLPVGGEDLTEELTDYETNLTTQETSIRDIIEALEGKAAGDCILQDKTIEIKENGTQIITPDEGYDAIKSIEVDTNIDVSQYKFAPTHLSFKGITDENFSANWSALDLRNLTTMSYMFYGCSNLKEIDLSGQNTSNVTSMSYMFSYDTSSMNNTMTIETIKLKDIDTSNVTSMSYMFYKCENLKELDLSDFNVNNLKYMNGMFWNCRLLDHLDLTSFNGCKPIQCDNLFDTCLKLTETDLGVTENWDMSDVTSMYAMFRNTGITKIDLSRWNTSKNTRTQGFFGYCKKLVEAKVSNWDMSNVTTINMFFQNCTSLTEIDISGWVTPKVTTTYSMFEGCTALQKIDMRNLTFDKVTSSSNMFKGIPVDCLIIVKSDTEKTWVLNNRSDLTNVKTVAELEG